jgi:large subunit ribosomal protein L13
MKTYTPTPKDIGRQWIVVDAQDKVLGRVASAIASRLRGKHRPDFAPHMDTGDFVVVVNADKIRVTGNKLDQKIYYKYSGYPGGIRSKTLREMLDKKPELVITKAVKGMLPKNRLGRQLMKKLKVYAGSEHPHEAQSPQALDV